MKIPEEEIWFSFSRSGGPGGQNVNKVSSKVTLRWPLWESKTFSNAQKAIIFSTPSIRSLMDEGGVISLTCQISRSQLMNRKFAQEKLDELLRVALIPKKVRRKTKPSRGQLEKRLKQKKSRSLKLRSRKIQID